MPVIVAQCRAAFEGEAAADLARLGDAAGIALACDTPARPGYVVASAPTLDDARWRQAQARAAPVFIRTMFAGSGPHALRGATTVKRPDRVTPLVAAFAALAQAPMRGVWLEFPDTNDGKELSTLARALVPRVETMLRERGLVADDAAMRGHVFLPDGDTAYVGTSACGAAPAWPMGIPRLRLPYGAPSRSAAKLAEALLVFLGADEARLLQPGMRAVDLGAAPGGWSWLLAQRGLKVTAVDNGALKGDVAIDPRVTHVRADGLAWRPRAPVDWLVCDIVLQPIRIAALVGDWMAEGLARRAIVNLKLPMKRRYDEVTRCEAEIRSRVEKAHAKVDLRVRQLYHDREEVTAYVALSDQRAAR